METKITKRMIFLTQKELYKQAHLIGGNRVYLGGNDCVAGQLLKNRFPDGMVTIGRNSWTDFRVVSSELVSNMTTFVVPDSFSKIIKKLYLGTKPCVTGSDVTREMRKVGKKSHAAMMK